MNEIKCEIKGCENTGALLDHDGVKKCQEHIVEGIYSRKKQKPPKIKVERNDDCPCGSGVKYKRCCIGNPLKMWFIDRVSTRIYYYDPDCNNPLCESCKRGKNGIRIANLNHAIELYEFSQKHDVIFTNRVESIPK